MILREHDRQQLALTKQFLQQKSAMIRASLGPIEYVAYKLGCGLERAEWLVKTVREEGEAS